MQHSAKYIVPIIPEQTFGYEQGWPERLGVPAEYIDLYMAVPDEAKHTPTTIPLMQF